MTISKERVSFLSEIKVIPQPPVWLTQELDLTLK